jgi:hypothetical protein
MRKPKPDRSVGAQRKLRKLHDAYDKHAYKTVGSVVYGESVCQCACGALGLRLGWVDGVYPYSYIFLRKRYHAYKRPWRELCKKLEKQAPA